MKYTTWVIAGWVALWALAANGAQDLAVNVDGLADWMSSRAFIDASVMFRRWGMPGAGFQENRALKLTADNYPLGDADAVTFLRGYPDGVYKLRYEGTATVGFSGIGSVIPDSVKKAGGVTTAEVKIVHRGSEDLLNIQVRGVNAADPLRNLQLLTPGYADAKQVFTNEF